MGTSLEQRYALREKIAAGAVGTVWCALDRVTGERVAVKILHREVVRESDVVAAFREEGRILAELDHPGVVRLRDFVAKDGVLALIMDLVEGADLRRLVAAEGPLPPATAASVLEQVGEALSAVHAAGIVHGDVKPGNILVPAPAGTPGVRLVDFGVAQRVRRRSGATHATPEYVAPEIVDGDPPLPPSDVYATGLVLYETLTCRSPFRGGTVDQVLRRHREWTAARLPGIPEQLWRLIEACLEVEPAGRPSAAVLAGELRAVAAGLVGLPPVRLDDAAGVLCRRGDGASCGAGSQLPGWPVPERSPVGATGAAELRTLSQPREEGFVGLDELLGSDGVGGSGSSVVVGSDPHDETMDGTDGGAARSRDSPAVRSAHRRLRRTPRTAVAPGDAASAVPVGARGAPRGARATGCVRSSTVDATPAVPPAATGDELVDRAHRRMPRILLGAAAGTALTAGLALAGWLALGAAGHGTPQPVADKDRRPVTRAHRTPVPRTATTPRLSVTARATPSNGISRGPGSARAGSSPRAGRVTGGAAEGDARNGDQGNTEGTTPAAAPGLGDPMPTMPGGRSR